MPSISFTPHSVALKAICHRNDSILALATSPGNLPVVRFLDGCSVRFGSRPGPRPNPLCLGWILTGPDINPRVFARVRLGLQFQFTVSTTSGQLQLQLSISVLMISLHDEYGDCAVLVPLSPPAHKFAIRPIFVEWLWNNMTSYSKFADFQWRLNEHWSDRKSESGK
jgi:hypothetical protein